MSPKCEMLMKTILAAADTTDMTYEEDDIVADLCNSVSRDKLLKGYVATNASGSNPCMVELMTKLKSLDLVGIITNPDKCEEAIRASFAEKRRMSIMVGEGAEDRDLFWGIVAFILVRTVIPTLIGAIVT